VPLKLVIGTGEFVYLEEKREIEEIFGVPYVSEYGCTETGVIAFDCPRGGMHVMVPNIYLEVLKEDRPVLDQEGDICITELNSLHAPFVRYKIGDRGKLVSRPCPCGLHWPLLEVLAGRRDDYVITPEGEKIYDAIFAYTLKDGVAYFKAVQESPSSVVVYLVPDAGFDDACSHKYLATLQERLGGSVQVRFELVQSIERTKAGKFRYFERRF
jgi:phenylacetate-CoA ligase